MPTHRADLHRDSRWTSWMVAAQAGDRVAYDNLLRDCIPFIKVVARRLHVKPEGMDDVVQDTLLAVHMSRQSYDPARPFNAWIRMIAQRRAIDWLRRARRRGLCEIHSPLAYVNHPDAGSDARDADCAKRLAALILSLPARQRDAIEYLAFGGHTLASAAAASGHTEGSLKVSMHRAAQALHAWFDARVDEGGAACRSRKCT